MIITILDWIGTIMVLIAAFILSSKISSKPKNRMWGFIFFLVSNIFWIPFAILLQAYGLLVTQVILFFTNLRGIINCIKEAKNEYYHMGKS